MDGLMLHYLMLALMLLPTPVCLPLWVASCRLGDRIFPASQSVVRHILDQGLSGAMELREQQQQQQQPQGKGSGGSSSSITWTLMYKWHNKRYLGAAHGERIVGQQAGLVGLLDQQNDP
jgi:lipopolysaccharide export LptBFGC system permease protein LptF